MDKKTLNQNAKYTEQLIDLIEPDFNFSNKPLNRFKIEEIDNENNYQNKIEKLSKLKKKINSIENCNLKDNSKNLILGDGNIKSPIMIIGETPGEAEDDCGFSFQGEVGPLLKKMLLAIDLDINKIYKTYSINFFFKFR